MKRRSFATATLETAVWGLRVIGPGLAGVVAGLVALLWSTGTGQAILAVGIGIYLVGVVITVVGIVLVYREVPPPRPNFINLRWSLLDDAVHARPASAGQRAEGPGQLTIAVVGDPEAVPDLAVFAAGMAGTLEQLGVGSFARWTG